jgi:isopentenyl-diphosphate delta-isomerase type 1
MEDLIALVDINDRITGYETKGEVHRRGLLHRAFSVFIVRNGKMLIQRRNPDKYHSGGLWSNTCCSHQRKGEELQESVHRRMIEEMGIDCELTELFSFVYRTQFRTDLTEYEYDHVFAGSYEGEVSVNPEEASEIRWIPLEELGEALEKTPEKFSSWFIISAPEVMKKLRGKEAARNSTLEYYNRNAGSFTSTTVDVEFTDIQDWFLRYLEPGALILDFGCGSGRDSRYFLSKGFRVEACDGSEEMVRAASKTAGIPVRKMLFEELDEEERYDGIFACASILHVPFEELPDILAKMERALKKDGAVYVSFKYGTFEGERNGRFFTDMTMERLQERLEAAAGKYGGKGLHIVGSRVTGDVRPGRESEKWLNAILQKNGS